MPKPSKYGAQLNVRVEDRVLEEFREQAKRMGVSQTDAVRCALEAWTRMARATEGGG